MSTAAALDRLRTAPPPLRRVEPAYLSEPADMVATYGPIVAELCAAAGFAPDPEQELILDLTFAVNSTGQSAAFEVDIIGPRQNLKTGSIIQIELGWIYVRGVRTIAHTAHKVAAMNEAFRDMRAIIDRTPALNRRLDPRIGKPDERGVSKAATLWGLHFVDEDGEQRLLYKARGPDGGRALAADKVVMDEFFAASAAMMGDFVPTLASRPDPQIVTASSGGKLESEVLREHRKRGRNHLSPRQAYIEYGDRRAHTGCALEDCRHEKDARGCALDDESRWAGIMTALGRRLSLETVRATRQNMPPAEFAREFMVWWDDPVNGEEGLALNADRWTTRCDKTVPQPTEAYVVLDVEPDGKGAAIGVGAAGTGDKTLMMAYRLPNVLKVVPKLTELIAKHAITEVAVHARGRGFAQLATQLDQAGIAYETFNSTEASAACTWAVSAINETGEVQHVGQADLDSNVLTAATRKSGDLVIWDRREGRAPIGSLVAASQAAYRWAIAHAKEPAPPPPSPRRVSARADRVSQPDPMRAAPRGRRRSDNVQSIGF